jgi:hypothetical protein
VEALLMGGQACVLYGAAEFSRDTDLAILGTADNLARLSAALSELDAAVIAVPTFEQEYLERGHAIHFECRSPDAAGMRVDIMGRLRGVDPFPDLWRRRSTLVLPEGDEVDALSLPDLVRSKKTQRDKDWPMLRRLVEVDYFSRRGNPTSAQVDFWLRELRTPPLLIEAVQLWPDAAATQRTNRPVLAAAVEGDESRVAADLATEERVEREADRRYWAPLRAARSRSTLTNRMWRFSSSR